MILQYKKLRYCAVCLCSVLLLTVLAGCGDSVSKNTALLEQSLADAGSGKWKELRFSRKGKTVTLPMTLVTYENVVIKYEV